MQINENISRPMTTWLKLVDSSHKKSQLGELMFSLSYLPTAERLTVVVVKARNLNLKTRTNRPIRGQQQQLVQQSAIHEGGEPMTDDNPMIEVDSSESIFVKVGPILVLRSWGC